MKNNMSNSHSQKATTKEFLAGWCLLAKFHLHEAAEEDIIFLNQCLISISTYT